MCPIKTNKKCNQTSYLKIEESILVKAKYTDPEKIARPAMTFLWNTIYGPNNFLGKL